MGGEETGRERAGPLVGMGWKGPAARIPEKQKRKEGTKRQSMWGAGKESRPLEYSEAFRRKMVQKLSVPNAKSASQLSREVGVSQVTLSRWLREARKMAPQERDVLAENSTVEPTMKRRPEDWSFAEKLRLVMEAEDLAEEELGTFLRQKGIREGLWQQWRVAVKEALEGAPKATPKKSEDKKKIRALEKELKRKEKALAEAAALLVLQKKVQALWGDEEDDTKPNNGK